MKSTFHIRLFSEKMENCEIHIFIPNSQNLEFIKSLTKNIELIMIWQMIHQWWLIIHANSKSQFHIFGTDHQLFGKWSKKSGENSYSKKRRLSENVPKVVKHLYNNALFTCLIAKWLINHKEYKFNDFGLKITIFEISKIKLFENFFFNENCSSIPKVSSVKLLFTIWYRHKPMHFIENRIA